MGADTPELRRALVEAFVVAAGSWPSGCRRGEDPAAARHPPFWWWRSGSFDGLG